MNGLAQVIGSLLMYGIAKTCHSHLAAWRIMFLICGALTAAMGIVFYFLMPSDPTTAWFLTEKERQAMRIRMMEDREGGDRTNFSLPQLKEALFDYRSWFVFWFGILVTMDSSVLTFASLIIKNLNYNSLQSLLYVAPSGAVQIAFIWIGLLGCMVFPRNRCLVVILLSIPPLVGNILLLKLSLNAGWGLIVSAWLASCISDVMAITMSLSASNTKGNTKRAVTNTLYFIGYCVGCIGGPQLWKNSEAPRYFEGVVTSIVDWCLFVVCVAAYWVLCSWENKRRDREAEFTDTDQTQETARDITDKEDRLFRYSY